MNSSQKATDSVLTLTTLFGLLRLELVQIITRRHSELNWQKTKNFFRVHTCLTDSCSLWSTAFRLTFHKIQTCCPSQNNSRKRMKKVSQFGRDFPPMNIQVTDKTIKLGTWKSSLKVPVTEE